MPAVVAGLELILRQFGTKSWREVSQPAIRLAEEGIEFDAEHQRHLDRCAPKFDSQSLREFYSRAELCPGRVIAGISRIWRDCSIVW